MYKRCKLFTFSCLCLSSRKRLTDWETDITPLVGEELLVEVLDDIPLTMHNFVSSLSNKHTCFTCLWHVWNTECQPFRNDPIFGFLIIFCLNVLKHCCCKRKYFVYLCRYGKPSSNWLTVIFATSSFLMASDVRHAATNFTSTAVARSLLCAWTWIQWANGELEKKCWVSCSESVQWLYLYRATKCLSGDASKSKSYFTTCHCLFSIVATSCMHGWVEGMEWGSWTCHWTLGFSLHISSK